MLEIVESFLIQIEIIKLLVLDWEGLEGIALLRSGILDHIDNEFGLRDFLEGLDR